MELSRGLTFEHMENILAVDFIFFIYIYIYLYVNFFSLNKILIKNYLYYYEIWMLFLLIIDKNNNNM